MNDGDKPASPIPDMEFYTLAMGGAEARTLHDRFGGLTKREHIAAMAMQGFCSISKEDADDGTLKAIAYTSVCIADALLAELEK